MKKILAFYQKLSIYDKVFIVIFLLASFLRLYNLKGTLEFLGDQGRDALIVSKIFKELDLVFIGPTTSVGNMYLGPLYYYFMLPFLWLSYPSPLGPAYGVAILAIITLFLMYFLGKKMFSPQIALISSFFYAFANTIIRYSRFSWNPNPAPLFTLLLFYCLYRVQKNAKYWLGVFVCLAVLFQLHYLTLLAGVSAGLVGLVYLLQKKLNQEHWRFIAIGLTVFLLTFTPLVLFDIKHNFLNVNAFKNLFAKEKIFTANSNPQLNKIFRVVHNTEGRAMHILFEYMIGKDRQLNQVLVFLFIALLLIVAYQQQKKTKELLPVSILSIFLMVGVFGTALYQYSIADHYISYLFPITALTYGLVFDTLIKKSRVSYIFLLAFTLFFFTFNQPQEFFKATDWTIDNMNEVSQTIAKRAKEFNQYSIILLGPSNDLHGQNYRYFLSTTNHPAIEFEQTALADAVFVIDEFKQGFEPSTSPIYEISTFPSKEIVETIAIPQGPLIHLLRK